MESGDENDLSVEPPSPEWEVVTKKRKKEVFQDEKEEKNRALFSKGFLRL
jgi:hypothetical protein